MASLTLCCPSGVSRPLGSEIFSLFLHNDFQQTSTTTTHTDTHTPFYSLFKKFTPRTNRVFLILVLILKMGQDGYKYTHSALLCTEMSFSAHIQESSSDDKIDKMSIVSLSVSLSRPNPLSVIVYFYFQSHPLAKQPHWWLWIMYSPIDNIGTSLIGNLSTSQKPKWETQSSGTRRSKQQLVESDKCWVQ